MNVNGLSRQALNNYFSDKAKSAGQMQGKKKRLVIQHDKNTTYLDYRPLTTLEKVKAFFGFGDASFRNIARFCAEKHITHEKFPESIDAYNSKKILFKRVDQVFRNRILNNAFFQEVTRLAINADDAGYKNIQKLISQGADVNAVDTDGSEITALMHACIEGDDELVQFLLDQGADIEAKDIDGNTALMHAIHEYEEDDTTLQVLLKAGATIDEKTKALAKENDISLERHD